MKLLKFYADWCGPCKGLSKIIDGAKDKITIPIEEYDIDNEMMMAQEYKVRSVPTMVLVDDTGAEIKRQVGMVSEEKLLEFLKG
jgi:thioredoxin 1